MRSRRRTRATKAELAYVRRIERTSVFARLDRGQLDIVAPRDYPEPMKRFLARERPMLHIRLSPRVKRKIEILSDRTGVAADELARRWIEEAAARHAG